LLRLLLICLVCLAFGVRAQQTAVPGVPFPPRSSFPSPPQARNADQLLNPTTGNPLRPSNTVDHQQGPQHNPNELLRWDDAEPFELLSIDSSLEKAQHQQTIFQNNGLRLLRRTTLPGLGEVLSTYLAPDTQRYLQYSSPASQAVPNHRYELMGETQDALVHSLWNVLDWPPLTGCRLSPRIGLIDTKIETSHPVLIGGRIDSVNVLLPGMFSAPATHGTAVASILVGQSGTPALLPRAHLLAVNAFFQREGRINSTAELLLRAIDHLLVSRVEVINLSFGGPANRLLEHVVQRVHAIGVTLVAASGNGGADAPPSYPAAYDNVVAVVAVDTVGTADEHAQRGRYLDFSAPGVDIPVASTAGGLVYRSGSSYAAPFVTALFAVGMGEEQLQQAARDLGVPGRDDVYGWGLVKASGHCTPKNRPEKD
jgi:hypothetical protein